MMPRHEDTSALFSAEFTIVVGAARYGGEVDNIALSGLIRTDYGGKIFPASPNDDTILGLVAFRKLEGFAEARPWPAAGRI
jgi:acyl-CoA synthetase (NDP forming)